MKFTDEFRALLALRDDSESDARSRVIGAVMQRIEQDAAQRESVAGAIRRMAWPAVVTSVLAASIVVAARSISSEDTSTLNPPSTAQALGLPPDFVLWTERRDRAPQLFELMTAASLTGR
jgi:hypothetical protein